MAELAWAVLCDSSAFDMDSNRASLFNITEKLLIQGPSRTEVESAAAKARARGKTALLPARFQLVQWWVQTTGDPSESVTAQIVLESPEGHLGPLLKHTMAFDTGFGYRWRTNFESMPYRGWGLYWFCVYQFAGGEHELQAASTRRVARVPLLLLPPDEPEKPKSDTLAERGAPPAKPTSKKRRRG